MEAGRVGGIMENTAHPSGRILENLEILTSLFATAIEIDSVKAVICFGSSCILPSHADQPMFEDLILSSMPELTSLPMRLPNWQEISPAMQLTRRMHSPTAWH